ncbi:MAG: Mu-like prophage major head subunit gpT family protein [Candidatus Auribacterota bacterium]
MTATRSNFVDLLDPSFRHIIFDEYSRRPEYYSQVFNVEHSDRQSEKISQVSSFGLFSEKAEGASITYDDPVQGYDVEVIHAAYALGFRVTEEMYHDDQFRIMRRMPQMLAVSAKETVETTAWSLINNGFSVGSVFGDGKPLFAADHPLILGGTASNTLATAADLSATSLKQAIQDFEETVDYRGLPLRLRPDILMVPPALEWTAKELLKSDQAPHSQNNEINAIKDRGISLIVNPYLTDPDGWYLIDSTHHQLYFFWRKPLAFDSDTDFNTGDGLFKASMRFSRTAADWRGIFGSPGA